ncbi:single-stranded DNA-binding protein [Halobacteriovorax sp. GB3]|uniref:single-stranded DNA-binding protein n=1 Tax=Halobacteriovorax sp. GB3 TaxID=2719615 RepID=UPI00235ECD1E|nr:single-stranded DNA-binding protein [Halobacteriovorax sp. GB3]MDD0852802.1 single-stranded DNA-binding protein [Halobacteriovorax sp. GB3]
MNKAILIGQITDDVQLQYTKEQRPFCRLSLATKSIKINSKGEKTEYATWHRVLCFNDLALSCYQNIKKGQLIYVEGPLRSREYTDQKQIHRKIVEIHARHIDFLEGDQKTPSLKDIRALLEDESADPNEVITTDDIPF